MGRVLAHEDLITSNHLYWLWRLPGLIVYVKNAGTSIRRCIDRAFVHLQIIGTADFRTPDKI